MSQTLSEIDNAVKKYNHKRDLTALNTIKSNPKTRDNETLVAFDEVLPYAWALTKSEYAGDMDDSIILDNLSQNKETGGGCNPGITGRLIQSVITLMATIARNKTAAIHTPETEERELQAALRISAEEAQIAEAIKIYAQQEEPEVDAELAEAMRISALEGVPGVDVEKALATVIELSKKEEQIRQDEKLALEIYKAEQPDPVLAAAIELSKKEEQIRQDEKLALEIYKAKQPDPMLAAAIELSKKEEQIRQDEKLALEMSKAEQPDPELTAAIELSKEIQIQADEKLALKLHEEEEQILKDRQLALKLSAGKGEPSRGKGDSGTYDPLTERYIYKSFGKYNPLTERYDYPSTYDGKNGGSITEFKESEIPKKNKPR